MITYETATSAPATQACVARDSIVEAMARTVEDMRAAGTTITAESLAVYGDYTKEEIAAHGAEAMNLARSRQTRRVG